MNNIVYRIIAFTLAIIIIGLVMGRILTLAKGKLCEMVNEDEMF